MNGELKKTFENVIGAGLIVFALIVTANLAVSGNGGEIAQKREHGSASQAVHIGDRLWAIYALDSELGAFNLETDIQGETAVLGGAVSEPEYKNLAEHMALDMDGVDQVDNLIVVVQATTADAG
ncbi:MAG: BON domain-containing protein [Wenzhouxiangellaceae bacterium]